MSRSITYREFSNQNNEGTPSKILLKSLLLQHFTKNISKDRNTVITSISLFQFIAILMSGVVTTATLVSGVCFLYHNNQNYHNNNNNNNNNNSGVCFLYHENLIYAIIMLSSPFECTLFKSFQLKIWRNSVLFDNPVKSFWQLFENIIST